MARKGNHQKNGLERHTTRSKKKGAVSNSSMKGQAKTSDVKPSSQEQCQNAKQLEDPLRRKSGKASLAADAGFNKHEFLDMKDEAEDYSDQLISPGNDSMDQDMLQKETSDNSEDRRMPTASSCALQVKSLLSCLMHSIWNNFLMENIELARDFATRSLRFSTASVSNKVIQFIQRQSPYVIAMARSAYEARDHFKSKFERVYPVVLKRLSDLGGIILLILLYWLDCVLRGLDSFVRMGSTSFFSIVWCSALSVFSMVGFTNFLIVMVSALLATVFLGFTLGILVLIILGSFLLWFYGSFWTTVLIAFLGGIAFMMGRERLALFIATSYSVYCAWSYAGWPGLLLAFNLSFISSDILIYILKNNIKDPGGSDGPAGRTTNMHGEPRFHASESVPGFENAPGFPSDRGPGVPSTSGNEHELNSDDEIARLLSCSDYYSVLGLPRYESIDASYLKREYRKKAMLVHPDKNMGNEKAAEAFKKLQNAYEILLDSAKRKSYDDELKREELLNYFRRFQSTSQKNGQYGYFSPMFARSEARGDDSFREARNIACKKCGRSHLWLLTKKTKSRARWCQDCMDFHQAKDGDGWVEQSSQPIFFGLFQKVEIPTAYICADSKIFDATEWYICQGMKCPVNTHKPSFHVNTNVSSKHGVAKGTSSGQRAGRGPTSNMEEPMTEEEFIEWLQNAVQSGMFDNFDGTTSRDGTNSQPSSSFKPSGSPGASGGSGSNSKRKKKGKRQW